MTLVNKPIWRVQGGYCTCCHEEESHKPDCMLVEWAKEKEEQESEG